MKNLTFLFILIVTISCKTNHSNPITQPNIILILVDDLGKEWVTCYGADSIQTPNIDELAESGILFNNVYAMPQCTPTRTTFLTGQYPFRHGWVNHWDVPRWGGGAHFDETLNPSIGIEMKEAGYKTCIAGKWQIDDFRVEPDAMTKMALMNIVCGLVMKEGFLQAQKDTRILIFIQVTEAKPTTINLDRMFLKILLLTLFTKIKKHPCSYTTQWF